jgi:hypothetical protein
MGILEMKLQGKLSFTGMDGSTFDGMTFIHGHDDEGRKRRRKEQKLNADPHASGGRGDSA